ncbi:MAG: HD domain-containing protein [Deltaproteobacteria bacterium]|jgi:uncharacterized protein|nr:HD domain-containing protein [Deltaproteobacteria bacterium]
MFDDNFYNKVRNIVEDELSSSSHDLFHVYRVYKNACLLIRNESVDVDIVKTATLLHDIARVREDMDTSVQ